MYHQSNQKAAPAASHSAADRKAQKYNTIDTANAGGQVLSASPAPGTNYNAAASNISPAPEGYVGSTAADTATQNPSNEVNQNSEFIDIMRKVPRILCERYELMDVLGKGAHGRIYLATDLVTHDRVAIKLVSNADN